MIALEVEVPFANFRKSFARSYAETYELPPPATVYGMLLSLVGERRRRRHLGARLAVGLLSQPKLATSLRKRSRYKYGVANKQSKLGNAPEYMEVLCGVKFLLWLDSSLESEKPTLEERAAEALDKPESIERSGVVCLGLSDDLVNRIARWNPSPGQPVDWVVVDSKGQSELPVWVDHVGSAATRWRRYSREPGTSELAPDQAWTTILGPEEL
ncbi:MAG TPA: type I-MYXAN CRISPR-associated protein Cas5/Cmx5/DevS [Isosphaeraceae bacterium]|nr:type I-MYXAN CRISPR-associated protein Cas5/Cmx5/DevS [Isosphaeraceae bacterium]